MPSIIDTRDFLIGEYERACIANREFDKQILRVFGVTVIVSVSVLSTLWVLLLGSASRPTPESSFAALIPILLILTAFKLIISLRRELVRAAAFIFVFFEETSGTFGWEGALMKVRLRTKGESNDPIPSVFLSLIIMSGLLVILALVRAQANGWQLFLLASIVGLSLGYGIYLKRAFGRVVSHNLAEYIQAFREIRGSPSDR